jgi:hypothetical protein
MDAYIVIAGFLVETRSRGLKEDEASVLATTYFPNSILLTLYLQRNNAFSLLPPSLSTPHVPSLHFHALIIRDISHASEAHHVSAILNDSYSI